MQQSLPNVLRSWLWALHAETRAAAGDRNATHLSLERATELLPGDSDSELQFLFLDESHLARWRGHCHARLSASEAIEHLTRAAAAMDASFVRATASLRCDLALALAVAGELDAARVEVTHAARLTKLTMSVRQQRRVDEVIASLQSLAS